MWILRRLSELGVSVQYILLTYKLRIRTFVEMNVPLWNFNLSAKMAKKIEKLQKTVVYVILGSSADPDYFCNLAILELETLKDRRELIVKNFAQKLLKHPVHRNIFKFSEANRTRSSKKIIVPFSRTVRYERSSIPALAKFINENLKEKI